MFGEKGLAIGNPSMLLWVEVISWFSCFDLGFGYIASGVIICLCFSKLLRSDCCVLPELFLIGCNKLKKATACYQIHCMPFTV